MVVISIAAVDADHPHGFANEGVLESASFGTISVLVYETRIVSSNRLLTVTYMYR